MFESTPITSPDDTGARLPFCPRCRYPLRGLPGAGRCPECGLAYDEDCRMWVAVRRRGFCSEDLFLVAFVIGLVCSGVFVWVVAKIGTRLPGWIWAFSVPYLMYTMASLVLWHRRRLRGTPYLAVLSDSIWCMTWRGAIANVPLSSVKKLTIHYAITGYSLRISRRPLGQTLVTNLFKTRELAIEAASEIGLRSGCELTS